MKASAIKKINIAIIVFAVLTAIALYVGGAGKLRPPGTSGYPEDGAASFFGGAVIKWIVPNNPGGGYDEYARLITPYLEKYTGAHVQVRNIPGSGGMRAVSELFKSPADGLTIGLINGSGMVTNQFAGISNTDYEIGELSFLGRVTMDVRVLALSAQSEHGSFADIMNTQKVIKIGATGLGGSTYVDAVVTREVFGLKMNVIHGFNNSSTMRHAIFRGNIDALWGSWGSVLDDVVSGRMKLVLQCGLTRDASLPDVPTVFEFVGKTADPIRAQKLLTALEALHLVGRAVAAPPGMSSDRLKFLREAFMQALHDPQFLDDAAKAGRPILFASGEEMGSIVGSASIMPTEIQQIFVKAMRSGLH